jgi:serine/threonine protein kinase
MVGFSPFYMGSSNDNYKMYDLILKKPVYFPDSKKHGIPMSSKCKNFINSCLKKNPKERLGSKNGPDDIISHPWFSDLCSEDILNKKYEPEFKP